MLDQCNEYQYHYVCELCLSEYVYNVETFSDREQCGHWLSKDERAEFDETRALCELCLSAYTWLRDHRLS